MSHGDVAQTGRKTRWRRWRWILSVAPIGVFLVAAEIGLRIDGRYRPEPRIYPGERTNKTSSNFIPDELVGWRMKPSHDFRMPWGRNEIRYRSNALGFRSVREFVKERTGKRRIAVVGDSHSFALGLEYDKSFGARLEQSMKDVEVLNFALPGSGVDQMWLTARHYALPLKPDVLIVALYGSDFPRTQTAYRLSEGFNKPLYKLVGGRLVQREAGDTPSTLEMFLERHSYLWAAVRLAVRWFGIRHPIGEFWTLNQAVLDQLREDCREAKVPVVFVFIPFRSWKPFPALEDYMRRTRAKFIDLSRTPPTKSKDIYFFLDGHLAAPGHYHVAELLREHLRPILPPPSK